MIVFFPLGVGVLTDLLVCSRARLLIRSSRAVHVSYQFQEGEEKWRRIDEMTARMGRQIHT